MTTTPKQADTAIPKQADTAIPKQADTAIDRALAGAVLLAALAGVWLPAWMPGQDFPHHLLTAQVLATPERFAEWVEPSRSWSSAGFVLLTRLFMIALPVGVAAKAAMTACVALFSAGTFAVAGALGTRRWVAGAGGAVVATGWVYAMGFANFLLAAGVAMLAFAVFVGATGDGARRLPRQIGAATLVVLAAALHPVVGGMAAAQCLLFAAVAGGGAQALRAAAIVAPGLVTAATIVLAVVVDFEATGGGFDAGATWLPPLEKLTSAAFSGMNGFGTLGMLGNLAVGAGILASRATRTDRRVLALAAVALFWIVVFLATPLHGLGWHFASPRTLVFASALAGCALRDHTLARPVTVLLLVAALANTFGAVREGRRVDAAVASFEGAAAPGTIFQVVYGPEPAGPSAYGAEPMRAVAAYAALSGGVTGDTFAFNQQHAIRFVSSKADALPDTAWDLFFAYRDGSSYPAAPLDDETRADLVASAAVAWDSIALVNPPPLFVERLRTRGFSPEAPGLWRPNPSSVRVQLTVPPDVRGDVLFRAGFPPEGWFRRGRVPRQSLPPADAADRTITLGFDGMPAGSTQLQVFVDVDGDGGWSGPDQALVPSRLLWLDPGQALQVDAR